MPELPEVETTLRGIKPQIIQQSVGTVIVRHSQLRWPIPSNLNTLLKNKKLERLERRSKYLLFYFTKGALILHLGMSGKVRILLTPTPPQKHDHVDIRFQNGVCLRLTDPRRFGALLYTADDPLTHPLLTRIGPEPLTREFTGHYLHQKSRGRQIAIKPLVMDAQIVAGVGNIYATEALFQAGINPKRPANSLNLSDCLELTRQIKSILKRAIRQGGTTLKDFTQSDGSPGYFHLSLKVYGQAGKPCPQCARPLTAETINQRSTVYCKQCQL